jgi:hypothetical protein
VATRRRHGVQQFPFGALQGDAGFGQHLAGANAANFASESAINHGHPLLGTLAPVLRIT